MPCREVSIAFRLIFGRSGLIYRHWQTKGYSAVLQTVPRTEETSSVTPAAASKLSKKVRVVADPSSYLLLLINKYYSNTKYQMETCFNARPNLINNAFSEKFSDYL